MWRTALAILTWRRLDCGCWRDGRRFTTCLYCPHTRCTRHPYVFHHCEDYLPWRRVHGA